MADANTLAGVVRLPAQGTFDEVFARLEQAVAARKLAIFARIDFAADAAAAGLELAPARLLIFGNPKAGTPLIAAAPTVALDLPLKVLVWRNAAGAAWVGYNDPDYLVQRHELPAALAQNIQGVRAIAANAAGA
jgi:uncharacterized protein (DUF302 family)